ncbi:MAG: hypothetical protein K6A80_09270 [Saccharofermentans sp.]|nr:hypothetical protein [Saccharofermentans sp.]
MTESRVVFVDTTPYIYGLEHNDQYYDRVKAFFADSKNQMVTSAITVEEYCIVPYRNKETGLINNFKRFLADTETRMISIDTDIRHC